MHGAARAAGTAVVELSDSEIDAVYVTLVQQGGSGSGGGSGGGGGCSSSSSSSRSGLDRGDFTMWWGRTDQANARLLRRVTTIALFYPITRRADVDQWPENLPASASRCIKHQEQKMALNFEKHLI